MKRASLLSSLAGVGATAAALFVAACADQPTSPERAIVRPAGGAAAVTALDCQLVVATKKVTCGTPAVGGLNLAMTTVGGQGTNVQLTSSNLSSSGGIFSFDVTLQNLLPEGMGTPDGVLVDTAGIKVVFVNGPSVTGGTGSASVANADGVGDFTAADQPYFRYDEALSRDEVSNVKTWQIAYDPGVTSIGFRVYVVAELQPLLIINEVMANPAGPSSLDTDLEWFEVYNAGRFPVQMQGMVIADSAASGRRPYHLVSSPVEVPSNGYVVLGNSTNTSANGGAPVDYAYGGALTLANSLDAVKVARVYGTDTLTLDRTQYSNASVSAQSGISRELKNPALDNSNMDGSNWGDASVTSVYGSGGRGTPKAQNSVYTP